MASPSNEVLGNMITNLTTTVQDGFSGVHDRQDKTNGKVVTNTDFRVKQETSNRWMYGLVTLLVLPMLFLVGRAIIDLN